MPQPDKYTAFVIGHFAPLGRITSRYMFGGWCVYCDDTAFCLIADGAVWLKGDDVNIPAFEARGLKAFAPFADKPEATMKYFQAPPEIFEDEDAMREWCGGAIRAGNAKKKKAAPAKKRKNK